MFVAKLVLMAVALMVTLSTAFAQIPVVEWDRVYPDSFQQSASSSICATNDGSYFVAGSKSEIPNVNRDIYITKIAGDGEIIWMKKYTDQQQNESSKCIIAIADGNYVFCGEDSSGIIVTKIDLSGNIIWQKHHDYLENIRELSYQIISTSDKGFLIDGWTWYPINEEYYMYLLKLDEYGDYQWHKEFFKESKIFDLSYSITTTNDGGFIFVGRTDNKYGWENTTAIAIKIDTNANIIWKKDFGIGWILTIIKTFDNNYILAVSTYHNGFRLIKINESGEIIWDRHYNFADWCIQVLQLYNYQIIGLTSFDYFDRPSEIRIAVFDTVGSLIYSKALGDPQKDTPKEMTLKQTPIKCKAKSTFDEITLLTSYFYPPITSLITDMHLIKFSFEYEADITKKVNKDILSLYPNPFSSNITINLDSPIGSEIPMEIYNLNGSMVKTINFPIEAFQVTWNGEDENGNSLSSGVYFLTYNVCDVRKAIKVLKVQ